MTRVVARAMYKEWLKDDKLNLLKGWKRNGLSDVQVAHNMGISINTLNKWKRKYGQIRHALKKGKVEINFIVENALLEKAKKGNVTAMIFWLKNNWREKYSDNPKSEEDKRLDKARTDKAVAEAEMAKAQTENLTQASDSLADKMQDISTEELHEFIKSLSKGDDGDDKQTK